MRIGGIFLLFALCVGSAGCTSRQSIVAGRVGAWSIQEVSNGTLIADDFNAATAPRDLADKYEFNGDAGTHVGYVEAPGDGLRVGVRSHGGISFEGWFAVTYEAFPPSSIFHAHIGRPQGNLDGPDRAETVFAVQTASTKITGIINYVVVGSTTGESGTLWEVGYAHGSVANAKTEIFWSEKDESLAQDVTIRTDGSHHLTVWFDDLEVFASDYLHLNVEPPFQPYLEVQSEHVPYVATFTDFWVVRDQSLIIENAPPNETVCLDYGDKSQSVCAPTSADGTVHLSLPAPRCHGIGVITIGTPVTPNVVFKTAYSCGSRYRISR